MLVSFILIAAAAAASPSPSPSPPAPPLKEIGSVTARSPYCASFFTHFNTIVDPMVANDKTLDQVSVSLDNINTLFSKTDRIKRFDDERLKLQKYTGALLANNTVLQKEINELRRGEKLTEDPQRAHEVHMLAQELQRAYDKQHQMQLDLQSVWRAMVDYNLSESPVLGEPLGDVTLESLKEPAAAKDVKYVLRFNGMRDRLRDAEGMAAAHAQTILQKYC